MAELAAFIAVGILVLLGYRSWDQEGKQPRTARREW
jgi:hypothetical protein